MKRGELYRTRNPPGDPKLHRVVVIVSRQTLIDSRFSTVICAPVLSRGEGLHTQVPLGIEHGLKHESWIICDNLMSFRKSELTDYVGSLPSAKLFALDRALALALDLSPLAL